MTSPVSHDGLRHALPQPIREEGGYHLNAKTVRKNRFLLDEAKAVESRPIFAVSSELVRIVCGR